MKSLAAALFLFLVLCSAGSGIQPALAQQYPNQPIQIIIPAAPGDGGDIVGRLLTEELSRILNVQFVAVNKPGAAAAVGTDFVAKSKKDGYTLLFGITAGTVYAPAQQETPYDPVRDLDCLGFTYFLPCTLSVQSESPWKTFNDVIDYSKKNPGKFRFSTIGVGSINHLQLEIIKSLTNAEFTTIPFKGAVPAVTGLLGGHVEGTFVGRPVLEPHHQSGKLRPLLVDRKLSDMPNVPILRELGYNRDLPASWAGVYGPAGLPEDVKKVLVPAIEKATKSPEIVAKLKSMYFLPDYKPPAEQSRLLKEDIATAKELLKKISAEPPK